MACKAKESVGSHQLCVPSHRIISGAAGAGAMGGGVGVGVGVWVGVGVGDGRVSSVSSAASSATVSSSASSGEDVLSMAPVLRVRIRRARRWCRSGPPRVISGVWSPKGRI
jgi:phage tail tape-measure protein